MTAALERVEGSASRPGRSLPLGNIRYPLCRRLGGPQGRSGQVRKISPPTGIRSPDRPDRSQSLYWLRYPAHKLASKTCFKSLWNYQPHKWKALGLLHRTAHNVYIPNAFLDIFHISIAVTLDIQFCSSVSNLFRDKRNICLCVSDLALRGQ
jgi:hypothetical protein